MNFWTFRVILKILATQNDDFLINWSTLDFQPIKIDFDLLDGDQISFFYIDSEYLDVLEISGSVKRPGSYELTKGICRNLLLKFRKCLFIKN